MRTNGVGHFGWKRWCNKARHKDWTAASLDAAMMFWIIMVVMINPDMRHLISHTKKGFARTAADGIESFKIALPLLTTRLQYHGYYLTGAPMADALYYFVHAYVNDHMSPAEFDAFFVGEVAEYYQY